MVSKVSALTPSSPAPPVAITDILVAQVFSANPNAPNLAVTSYESLRADVAVATSRSWDYAVLDEGHAIRNPKSAVTAACKRLVAAHRLVLVRVRAYGHGLDLALPTPGST